jgi:hypothetical protein
MIAPVVSVTTPLIDASPWARATRGAAAKNTKTNPTVAFQIRLLVCSRGMCFFSSGFSGIAVVLLSQKTWPKKKNPTANMVLAVGF